MHGQKELFHPVPCSTLISLDGLHLKSISSFSFCHSPRDYEKHPFMVAFKDFLAHGS